MTFAAHVLVARPVGRNRCARERGSALAPFVEQGIDAGVDAIAEFLEDAQRAGVESMATGAVTDRPHPHRGFDGGGQFAQLGLEKGVVEFAWVASHKVLHPVRR